MSLNNLKDQIHATAKKKGWWGIQSQNIPEKLCLIHSEISEALEEYRVLRRKDLKRIGYTADNPKPVGFGIELADAIIRILDLCGHLKIDIEENMRVKMDYNKTRPYRHGNKHA